MAVLLLASQNPGKLNEMRLLVAGLPFGVVGPLDLGIRDAPEETGHTFLENAVLKALALRRRLGPAHRRRRLGPVGRRPRRRARPLLEPVRRRGRHRLEPQSPASREAPRRAREGRAARFTSAVAAGEGRRGALRGRGEGGGAASRRSRGARAASATTPSSTTRPSGRPSARYPGKTRTA